MYDNGNPLVRSLGSTETADPFVFRFNGWYYMYMTTGGKYIRGYKSTDLVTWEPVTGSSTAGVVYDYGNDGNNAPNATTPFAPEVTYYNGLFYLTFSPSGTGHYILTSESPEGPFTSLTGNFGKSIDGSFFLDSNEDIYFYTAGSGSINMYQLEDNFEEFKLSDEGNEIQTGLLNCRIGNWNEGPFMLQRDGAYYFTYCGEHYLSKDYHVDYAYCKPGSDVTKMNSYERKDTVLLSTETDYYGLGHSCTVLGPDMDSYYIIYHELEKSGQRNYCASRLSFDGSKMVANDVKRDGNFAPSLPKFADFGTENMVEKDGFLLSSEFSGEDFTVEFNAIGEGKFVFSFIDSKNYSYIELKNDVITVNKIIDGVVEKVTTINLIKSYDYSVYHTLRLSYGKGKMDIFFDNMEKANDVDCYFGGGRIGYFKSNKFSEIGYNSFSNVSQGSSDKLEYNTNRILCNAYDDRLSFLNKGSELVTVDKNSTFRFEGSSNLGINNKNDRATYRIYANESTVYNFNLRINSGSIGKKIGVRIDNENIVPVTLDTNKGRLPNDDIYLNIYSADLEEGQHYISLYNIEDAFSFSEITMEKEITNDPVDLIFNSSTSLEKFTQRGEVKKTSNGLQTEQDHLNLILTKNNYMNATISTQIKFNNLVNSSYVGLMINVGAGEQKITGDADYFSGDNENNYQGYVFMLTNEGKAKLKLLDYNFSIDLYSVDCAFNATGINTLEVTQTNNLYKFTINNNTAFELTLNVGRLQGRVGVMSYKADTLIKNINIL